MRRIIIILCIVLCTGFGLNLGFQTEVIEPVSDPYQGHQYQARNCEVVECYPDEAHEGFQWVYVVVSGGEYDGHLYEMHRPIGEHFHAYQGLEVVFDTAETSDPTDDMPVNVIKPNMV